MDFSNDLVLVTGSSRGIGKAIALAFARHGATIILNGSKDKTALLNTKQFFLAQGFNVFSFFGDLSQYDTARQLFTEIKDHFNRLPNIIINNAGISYVGLFTDTTPTLWNKLLTTNINTAYHCTYLALPEMLHNHHGSIINISSIWGKVGASCEVAYSTSKAAINGFTKSLAKELGPSNIRVNAIACGWIDTQMTACYSKEEKESFIEEIPLCRTGTPEEVAKTCLYLASPLSSYMTGQILTLDGGLL